MELLLFLIVGVVAFALFSIFRKPPGPTERELELAALSSRYQRLMERGEFDVREVESLVSALMKVLEPELRAPMLRALRQLVRQEQLLGELPDFASFDLKQQVEFKNRLSKWELKAADDGATARELIQSIFTSIMVQLPKVQMPSPFMVPVINVLEDPKNWISSLYKTVSDDQYHNRDILSKLREQMYLNLCSASDITPYTNSAKRFKHAFASDLPLERLNRVYLADTPLHDLMASPVPLKFTHDDRMNHMHVIGGTGAGKTTLIENLILHDLQSDNPPSLVLIDPHGDLIAKLKRADLGIQDRLVIIDPRDINHPPALNVFALNTERMERYDEATKEQVTAGVIQTFDYLFSGLVGADLTAKQGVFFRYVTRLLLSLPEAIGRNATILDMIRLMDEAPKGSAAGVPEEYRDAVRLLPDIPREFFERDFPSKTFAQTRDQIRYRLQAIIENPTLARLFTSPETKVDIFSEINHGSIILVDTAKDFLKSGSDNFGRIFISLTLQAVLERAAIPAARRKDTFLIVDEAASFFDSNIDDLLTEARKYRCGCVFAHQYLDQASSPLRASLAANTGIKFASGLSSSDARAMAPEMRTTPDFILAQPKLQFAAHIRNVTPHAVSIPFEPGPLDRYPKLSDAAYEDLIRENRKRVWVPRIENAGRRPETPDSGGVRDEPRTPTRQKSAPSLPPGDDISREW